MQKGLGTIKYRMGGCISILLDLMFISHEVGEINLTLMHTSTFLKVDLNCFTIKKGGHQVLKELIIFKMHCMVYKIANKIT
jgi:hypothetical protein